MPRPVVLISAVSRELQSARYVAANSLTAIGCESIWNDDDPAAHADPKSEIRAVVERAHAVLQIVGHQYGPAPDTPDEEFGPISYTSYEALCAHKAGKPVRYILLDGSHPTDCENDEPAGSRKLQSDYRSRVEAMQGLVNRSADPASTRGIVVELGPVFSKSARSRLKRPAALAALFLIVISAATAVFMKGEKPASPGIKVTADASSERKDAEAPPMGEMERILIRLADAENRARIPGESLTLGELRNRAYGLLETEFGLPAGSLAADLPAFALSLYESEETRPISRACAAYCLEKYEEAEKLFLEEQAKAGQVKGTTDLRSQRILALEGAAQFATAQSQFARALGQYRAAAELTSLERDPLEWARIHHMLAYALTYSGRYSDAGEILSQVVPVYEKHLGAANPNTLGSANNLANALNSQGKHAEAEQQHRANLDIRLRTLGPDHPDTLTSRSNLAATLNAQGKHAEAADQHRAALTAREATLSADHPATLFSRINLAIALTAQGKHEEAEAHYRAVLASRKRTLGEEHADTLSSHDSLAKNLRSQGKTAEAEEQFRTALSIRERVLGASHYDIFVSCHHLALSLADSKKIPEALLFAKRGLTGFTEILGPDHPNSIAAGKLVALLESRMPNYRENGVQ